jgi:NADH:ubiquinone reductase (non-electrogenic)
VQDTATAVVPDCPLSAPSGGVRGSVGGGAVGLASGQVLPYDWLVLSLGATARLELVPGAREHAIPFLTLDDVTRVQVALSNAQARQDAAGGRGVTVAVVGAALAGVELAAAVASVVGKQGGRVVLLAGGPTVMAENTDTQRSAAEAALTRAGVEVLPSRRVASITPTGASGEAPACYSIDFQAAPSASEPPPPPLAADVVLWTAGQRPAGKELLGPEWLDTALGGISTDTCLRVRCVAPALSCTNCSTHVF